MCNYGTFPILRLVVASWRGIRRRRRRGRIEDDDKQNEKEDRGAGHWRRWTKSRSGIGRE